MWVLKYFVENKALFEAWYEGKRKSIIIILWGIKIYVKQLNGLFSII